MYTDLRRSYGSYDDVVTGVCGDLHRHEQDRIECRVGHNIKVGFRERKRKKGWRQGGEENTRVKGGGESSPWLLAQRDGQGRRGERERMRKRESKEERKERRCRMIRVYGHACVSRRFVLFRIRSYSHRHGHCQ